MVSGAEKGPLFGNGGGIEPRAARRRYKSRDFYHRLKIYLNDRGCVLLPFVGHANKRLSTPHYDRDSSVLAFFKLDAFHVRERVHMNFDQPAWKSASTEDRVRTPEGGAIDHLVLYRQLQAGRSGHFRH